MSLTLYSFEGDFRAYKAQIAAAYNGVALTYSKVDVSDERSPAMLARSPVGKVPILETDQGSIFESNAIARYVARLRRDTELQGVSFFESGQVDSWVDFCSHELELPLTMWLYPVLGYTSYNKATHSKSVAEARRALELLESHLLLRTYLVGEKVTLADIVLVSALLYPMKFLFSPEFLAPFPCVNRWFQTCVNQPEFKSVVGPFVPCTEEMVAPGGVAGTTFASTSGKAKAGKAKAGKKDKAAKKAEKKEPEPEAAPAPAPAPAKPADPFAGLAKSPMNMDAWKREYSNSRPAYYSSMEYFWKNFDKDGYSLWWCTYQYNSENTVGFMTSNLVGGFIQRSDAVRKHAFGSMVIFGGETAPAGGYVIEGCWLMRGHSIQPMIDNNPDAEYYTWTQIDSTDEKQRERIGHFWCAESEIDGKALFDSSIFK